MTAVVTMTLQSPRLGVCVCLCVCTHTCRYMCVFYISIGKSKIVSEISTFTLSSNIATSQVART